APTQPDASRFGTIYVGPDVLVWAAGRSPAVKFIRAPVPKSFYSRNLPHLQRDNKPHFLTLCAHQRGAGEDTCPYTGFYLIPRLASSASSARSRMNAKNSGDWPMKSPMAVRKFTTPVAIPFVWVGRMIETTGSFRLRNGHGSGMIRLVRKSSPPNGGEFRSGKVTDTPVTGSTAVKGGALPALSDQVWKCIVSVGPMLIKIRRTSTLVALCAMEG